MKTSWAQLLCVSSLFALLLGCSPKEATPEAVTQNQEQPTTAPKGAPEVKAFEDSKTLQGITFKVTCPNAPGKNLVTITPEGLSEVSDAMSDEIDGKVERIEVDDLNVDQSPEIYVFGRSSNGQGVVLAYSANNKKSLSQIYLPPFKDDAKLSAGYQDQDEFEVAEGTFLLRFPLYDKEGKKTEKFRQIQYKLNPGEAGWILKQDKVIEF